MVPRDVALYSSGLTWHRHLRVGCQVGSRNPDMQRNQASLVDEQKMEMPSNSIDIYIHIHTHVYIYICDQRYNIYIYTITPFIFLGVQLRRHEQAPNFISWSQSIRSWKTLENRSFLGNFLSMIWKMIWWSWKIWNMIWLSIMENQWSDMMDFPFMLCMMIVKQSASKNVTMSLFPSCEPLVLVLLLVFTFVFSIFVSVLGAWLHVFLLFA